MTGKVKAMWMDQQEELAEMRELFEAWVVDHNEAEIRWIGHSYANAYMAAQWEGFSAALRLARGE